jgi:adenylate kinase
MGLVDEEVKRLLSVVENLESRVKKLEERSFGGSSQKSSDEVRMILIGPPGAGKARELRRAVFNDVF